MLGHESMQSAGTDGPTRLLDVVQQEWSYRSDERESPRLKFARLDCEAESDLPRRPSALFGEHPIAGGLMVGPSDHPRARHPALAVEDLTPGPTRHRRVTRPRPHGVAGGGVARPGFVRGG